MKKSKGSRKNGGVSRKYPVTDGGEVLVKIDSQPTYVLVAQSKLDYFGGIDKYVAYYKKSLEISRNRP